jgi:hypothetical protein
MVLLHLELLGQRVRVEGEDIWVREGVLAAAPLLARPPSPDPPHLVYSFRALGPSESLPPLDGYRSEAESAAHDFVFLRKGDKRCLVVDGKSVACFGLEEGRVEALVHPDHARDPWIVGHRLFFLPLLEWMRLRGYYPLHGSCFVAGEAAVVVCGPSGVGKSTATFAAIAAGCPIVADDTLFVSRKGGRVVLHPFPEPVKVGAGTARAFPELRTSLRQVGAKFVLPEEELSRGGRVSEAIPRLLLFPEIVDREESSFEPLSGEQAMVRLLPQSVLPADRERVEAHMSTLQELVRQAPAYRLEFARDFRRLPALAAELVREGRGDPAGERR